MTEQKQYIRQVAVRIFSDGFDGAEVVERDTEDQYSPQYIRLSDGTLLNRVYVCGVLTEVEDIGTDSEYFKLIISDPKGTFRAYVGMYQEIALASMADITAPCYVAVVAKVKSNEYNEIVYHNLAPESINVIDEKTYNQWVEETELLTAKRMSESSDEVV